MKVWLRVVHLDRATVELEPSPPEWLSAAESLRLSTIRTAVRRAQFESGRNGVRQLLAAAFGGTPFDWQLDAPREGPPQVVSGPTPFAGSVSIAHSGPWVLTAVSEAAVGVDIEQRSGRPRDWAGWQRLALTSREAALAGAQADRELALLMHWTAKEALGKAEGTGVTIPDLKRIECLPAMPGGAANTWIGLHADFVIAVHLRGKAGPEVPPAEPPVQWATDVEAPSIAWAPWLSVRLPR